MKTSNLREKADKLPQVPGSYIFKDKSGRVIYIGKAKNLRHRVKSYFSVDLPSDFKTAELVSKINDIEFVKVDSEFEALILEAELIKKYKPKYNIVLKDDRSRIYIVIRNEKLSISGKNYFLPKIITVRKPEITKKDLVFGPFPSSYVAKNILGTVRKIFPFRDCSINKFSRYKKFGSPCLFGHIGVCSAPCVNNKLEAISEYKKNISNVKSVLSGNVSKFVSDIEEKMNKSSKNKDFEAAAEYRDLLAKFTYVQERFRDAQEYIDNPYLVDDISKKSLEEIKDFLPILKVIPRRIECYDISNISGTEAVGSMVVAVDGKLEKSLYKRFKVKTDTLNGSKRKKQDDFGMMYEILYRRFKREAENNKDKKWGIPDLVIVDGGKPQVSAALQVISDLDFQTPIIGIAKKYEHIIYRENNGIFKEISRPKDSFGMRLIIKLRNESHRFAQRYHHLLRRKSLGN